jgi:hypothetical protein
VDIPEIQTIVDKLAHKKFFVGIVAIAALYCLEVPTEYIVVKMVGIVVVAITVVVCQTILDQGKEQAEVEK